MNDTPTPMMAQYLEIKAANTDCLLFYRMGDFYELFFDDAVAASQALGIALTKRGKHAGEDIPMCGVPVVTADTYLQKLIAAGFRVAVCEQTEDPKEAKKRGSKAVVRRDVVRLVTAGTLTEDTLLDTHSNNFLMSLSHIKNEGEQALGFSLLDISTGDCLVGQTTIPSLAADIARFNPREILVPDSLQDIASVRTTLKHLNAQIVSLAPSLFDSSGADKRISAYYHVATLDAFGDLSRLEKAALSGAIAYLERTQLAHRPRLAPPQREACGQVMALDAATRANLELTRTLSGERKGSLLSIIDLTLTAGGARELCKRLASPLTDKTLITQRLDDVTFFVSHSVVRDTVRSHLKTMPDVLRSLSRIYVERASPRDLAAVARACQCFADLVDALAPQRYGGFDDALLPHVILDLQQAYAALNPYLGHDLRAALEDELPLQKREGGFIRAAYRPELDEMRELSQQSRDVIARLQQTYIDETAIKNLKIKHNNILGYFIEISQQNGEKLLQPPFNQTYIHRQTLAGVMRFTTAAVAELQTKILSASERALALELDIFSLLSAQIIDQGEALKKLAACVAHLDVASSLAELAVRRDYCRPILENSQNFDIEEGRHPVVEAALKNSGEPFVANSCHLSPQDTDSHGRMMLITGPNMGGKSTYLRQNALIVLLAHIGSYVPARAARIGIVDKVFSRVGAADDLARGRSTFMVEMVETAGILHQATAKSLVILDEIGRGTATFDGLSIAWATLEHLHDVTCARTLFATHYHELTRLAARLPRLINATLAVREWEGDVVFLHEVILGAADRSYGIQVAKLAGLPHGVVQRARDILNLLEQGERGAAVAAALDDLPLFAHMSPPSSPPASFHPAAAQPSHTASTASEHPVITALRNIHPDAVSPREAMDALYQLKNLLNDSSPA